MTTIYGIKNCDSVKKARKWLEENDIVYTFHDFRVDGINKDQVEKWVSANGWDKVVNKRSTSWKQLEAISRDNMNDSNAINAIIETPTLIKRPVLEHGKAVFFGFSEPIYSKLF